MLDSAGGAPRVGRTASLFFIETRMDHAPLELHGHSSKLVRPGLGRKFVISRVKSSPAMIGTEFVIQRWCIEQVAVCT